MSDPKSGTYVSLTDDHPRSKKDLTADETAQDSGFISSSSVFLSSGDLDVEEEQAKTKPNTDRISPSNSSSALSFDPKNNNSPPHLSLKEQQLESTYLDSGLIADQELSDDDDETEAEEEHIVQQQRQAAKSTEMLVDKGINEWMCDRSVIDNDLESCNELTKPALVPRPAPMEALKHMQLWQVCYTQDEEGDT